MSEFNFDGIQRRAPRLQDELPDTMEVDDQLARRAQEMLHDMVAADKKKSSPTTLERQQPVSDPRMKSGSSDEDEREHRAKKHLEAANKRLEDELDEHL